MEKNNSSFPDMGVFSRKLILLCLLAAIVLLGFFVVLSAGKDPHSTQEPEMVSVSDPGTTPPPGPGGQISPMIVVGGETLYAGGDDVPLWYAETMGYLEKVAQAEYLGETIEPVPDCEEPAGELQTNYLPAGYMVYHFVTEEEDIYLIYSEEDSRFLYVNRWDIMTNR